MRVVIGAFGTRGDVQPMIGLAQALSKKGHSVWAAVPPSSLALARAHGLDVSAVGLDYEEVSRRSANGTFAELVALARLLRGEVEVQVQALEPRVREADLLVGSSVLAAGALLEELVGTPYAFFGFCPQLFRSAHHPTPSVPWQRLPRWLNRLSWAGNEALWGLMLKPALDAARARRGLRPSPAVWASLTSAHPFLACEPSLALSPPDHSPAVTQVGALVMHDAGTLSAATRAFLDSGPAPVFIGFGSMSDPNPARTTERLVDAVRSVGVRAIISRGWARLGMEDAGPHLHFADAEPHPALFPRCAAIVHHGGAGTLHAAARAGVPQVLMPQLLDQHYWANRVLELGLGHVVPRHDEDPSRLADALRACLADGALQARCRAQALAMRSDGVDVAIEHLEALAARRGG